MEELSICEIERIRADIINSMNWEEEEEDIYCCGLYNLFCYIN